MEYEGSSLLKWAELQLQGVMRCDDPRYRRELARVGLIFLDSAEMIWFESNGWRGRFASERMPKSYSWLV